MTVNRIHDLLPWFVNETLEPAEAESFERHLMDCPDCREELELLRKLRGELEAHGEEFLDEHPTPERLVSAFGPAAGVDELDHEQVAKLKRHLALCATCAEEARWLRGESTASVGPREPQSAKSARGFPWAAAAAVLLAAAALTAWMSRDRNALDPGSVSFSLLRETQRVAETGAVEIRVAPDASHIFLLIDVDLARESFPTRLEIVDENGRKLHEEEVGERELHDGRYLLVTVLRGDFPDGDYVGRLSVPGGTGPGPEYRFRVTPASP